MPPPELLEQGRRVLAGQPFSVFIGAQLDALEPGMVELSLPLSHRLLQQNGFVHGGVLSYLADNALTFAGGTVLGPVLTSEFKINYVRPAVHADQLVARATVLASGRTQAVCRCDVFLESADGRKLCAAAQGTIRKAD